jgi:hypothetical protein
MNQRSAIAMFLLGGGLLAPLAVLMVLSAALGRAATPVGVITLAVGVACLVVAKWPLLRQGRLISFGPRQLSARGRRFYWSGYVLVASGAILALVALPFR